MVKASSSPPENSPEITKIKKKKGRPSFADLQKRNQSKQDQKTPPLSSSPNSNRRSRRNASPELGEDDDDDERKEKKVKLVVRLPQSNYQQQNEQHFDNLARSTSSFSEEEEDDGENIEAAVKKRKINAVNDRSGDNDQEEKVSIATDPPNGSPLGSGPTITPLPDKKLLVFILDRLQKKDTYGVFSEPVDPNELPDYHEIIENPMDFGTLRRKLDAGSYSNLEQLEADVLLICSNAMQYNSSDTVYFRQARSILELAKRDFENLRHEGDDGELRPKVVRRGRPPSKHLKKPPTSTSVDRVVPEISSGAALATAEPTNGSGPSGAYNLRRAPPSYKFQTTDGSSHRSRNGENYSEWLADWNDEFPASILRADMKYGKRLVLIDETRRETYKQFHPSTLGHEPSSLSDLDGDTKQLMPVGLHVEHSYARSLARFAANLGPVAWKVASNKLGSVLPPGVKFGPGYVGENEASSPSPFFSFDKQQSSSSLACDGNKGRPVAPPTSGVNTVTTSGIHDKDNLVEIDRKLSSQNNMAVPHGTPVSGIRPGQSFHTPNKNAFQAERNGFNSVFGYNFPSQMGLVRPGMLAAHSGPDEAHLPSMVPICESTSTPITLANHVDSAEQKGSEDARTLQSGFSVAPNIGSDQYTVAEGKPSWQAVTSHQRQFSLPVQPDLNVQLQAPSSPSSGLRIGSPQQPDLALQL
ncbi:Bromo domain-containing protein [Heracleum sosnowskyi]|uniref:Bromo domain-containing protein n=1 Tax=Heracleum sosnowskyi TaxID=360622 RepID=A0AAD8JC05_9APIA|nr:Bromo domain-containing protein [Heracleum sosnowskyi]